MTGEADKAGRFEVSGNDFFDDVSDLAIKLTADGGREESRSHQRCGDASTVFGRGVGGGHLKDVVFAVLHQVAAAYVQRDG